MAEVYKSRVYTDRPPYADFDPPEKFEAIKSIIAKRLIQHPKAICSYSGGADSDIMIDLIEKTRTIFSLPPVKYVFFNTGLEMKAIKDHVKTTADKYGVEIKEVRPKISIVQAARTYGIPFVSKIMSGGLSEWQKKGIPLSIADEYEEAEDKAAKRAELKERYQQGLNAKEFFMQFYNADCERICVENPIPSRIYELPPYTQTIQPFEYGHPYSKKTCLWLKNLPKLNPTNILNEYKPYISCGTSRNKGNKDKSGFSRAGGATKIRSKTFPGIAKAMAGQWGK